MFVLVLTIFLMEKVNKAKTRKLDEICQIYVSGALDRSEKIRWVGGPRKTWFWQIFFKQLKGKRSFSFLPFLPWAARPWSGACLLGVGSRVSFSPVSSSPACLVTRVALSIQKGIPPCSCTVTCLAYKWFFTSFA